MPPRTFFVGGIQMPPIILSFKKFGDTLASSVSPTRALTEVVKVDHLGGGGIAMPPNLCIGGIGMPPLRLFIRARRYSFSSSFFLPNRTCAQKNVFPLSFRLYFHRIEAANQRLEAVRTQIVYFSRGSSCFRWKSKLFFHMAYLTLFEDFEDAGRYSWAAATLAFLYRELAKACRTGVVGIVGCLTLMQIVFVYAVVGGERLHLGRPTLLEEPETTGWPFRWNVRPDECHQTQWKPGAIQTTSWTTSRAMSRTRISCGVYTAICVEGRRVRLSRTPLICFEIAELHVPRSKVMLQFGLEQVTPPEDVEHVTRISERPKWGEDWRYTTVITSPVGGGGGVCCYGQPGTHPRHAPKGLYEVVFGGYSTIHSTSTDRASHGTWLSVSTIGQPYTHHPRLTLAGDWTRSCRSVLHRLPLLEGARRRRCVTCFGEPSHVVEPARRELHGKSSCKASAYSSRTTTSCRGLGRGSSRTRAYGARSST
ncbi:hypothetical protein H6P81_006072 [Aristolochia fimbriata]|uniref:Aminotransferase-like plant mobile domain-containing protein n=1 Tax=Aristolochia fimbriata TaxID=158543 RepID=A0AAV7F0W5_ARIFI|nr:hypothetical protein H6P81_006072 [Aristolochia fimbriata]